MEYLWWLVLWTIPTFCLPFYCPDYHPMKNNNFCIEWFHDFSQKIDGLKIIVGIICCKKNTTFRHTVFRFCRDCQNRQWHFSMTSAVIASIRNSVIPLAPFVPIATRSIFWSLTAAIISSTAKPMVVIFSISTCWKLIQFFLIAFKWLSESFRGS